MKVLSFTILIFLTISLSAFAQWSNVYQGDQFTLSRIYAGLYSTTAFPTDSVASYASANFRIGFKSQLAFSEKVRIKQWAAMQMEKNQPVAGFNSLELSIKPAEKLNLSTGLMATPTTVLRPNPTTWESQVETKTQSTIIPGRPGAKIAYAFSQNMSITYGYAKHGEQWAHHLNLTINQWKMAGYFLQNHDYFMALTFRKEWLENLWTYQSSKQLATSTFIHLESDMDLVFDLGYQMDDVNSEFILTGLRKYIKAPSAHVNGFFGMTYDWKTQEIIGQVFLSLF